MNARDISVDDELAICLVLLGLVINFCGVRYFRTSLTALGAVVGGVTCWLGGLELLSGASGSAAHVASALTGALVGAATFSTDCVRVQGAALACGWGGGCFGLYLATSLPLSTGAALVGTALLVVLFGGAARLHERRCIICLTALLGSYYAVLGVSFFAGGFPEPLRLNGNARRRWAALGYLTLFGALSALGALVQAGQRGAKGSAGGETDLEAAGHSCCCGGPAATAAGDDDRASLLRPSAPPPDLARARGARAVDTEPRSTRSPRDPPIAYAVRVEDGS